MKTKINSIIAIAMLSTLFTSCIKTDDLVPSSGLAKEGKSQAYNFSDSWGYMYAKNSKTLDNISNFNNDTATYINTYYIPTAFFMSSAGSSKFSTTGAGTITLNNRILASFTPGAYLGYSDYTTSTFSTTTEWTVSGSSLVPAFTESLEGFPDITGVYIPNWTKVSKESDLTIKLLGNTSNANDIFVEFKVNGTTSGTDRYLSKSITPGTNSCTFTSSELKQLADYNKSELGLTLRVIGDKYKKVEKNGRAYYIVNETYLTHAIYWAK